MKLGNQFLITAAVGADPTLIGTSYIVADLNRSEFLETICHVNPNLVLFEQIFRLH